MGESEILDYERRAEFNNDAEPQGVPVETKLIDHQGLQTSDELEPQEEVIYEIRDKADFHLTRALFIGNLRRPLNAIDFQNHLKELASASGGTTVERAWLNRTRTHAIILVDKEEGAQFIREKLNGTKYPSEEEDLKLKEEYEAREQERYEKQLKEYDETKEKAETDEEKDALKAPIPPRQLSVERHPLYVDYIPVKAINQWIYEEDKGPRNGKWKIVYENKGDEMLASHTLLNGDFMPHYIQNYHHPRYGRGRGGYRGSYPIYNRRGRGNYSYNNTGPRPYGVYPPRNNFDGPPNRGGYIPRGGRGRAYNPNRYERDSYVPSSSNNNGYHEDRGRPRTDSYQPSYRDRSYHDTGRGRSRSRSPL